jgi:hypothetical protein
MADDHGPRRSGDTHRTGLDGGRVRPGSAAGDQQQTPFVSKDATCDGTMVPVPVRSAFPRGDPGRVPHPRGNRL